MEVAAAQSLSSSHGHGKLSCPSSLLFQLNPFSVSSRYLPCSNSNSFRRPLKIQGISSRRKVLETVVRASSDRETTQVAERWFLQPIGDGDSRHIGYKVERPGAFEIASDDVIVGRLPEKADLVIPVATVSGIHARIQKKGGNLLLITDLDSTNGTFIDDKRLRPGVPSPALPGNRLTFGDTHLAIFLLSKLPYVDSAATTISEEKPESEVESTETASFM